MTGMGIPINHMNNAFIFKILSRFTKGQTGRVKIKFL